MDYAEALNNADAPGVLNGWQEGGGGGGRGGGGEERMWLCSRPRGKQGRKGAGARKEGIAGRAGDFARRVIVKLSSIYFTNLHTTSAVVAAARRGYQEGCSETSVLDLASTCTNLEGILCVLPSSRKGLRETTDFVTPATSVVARPREPPFSDPVDLQLDDNLVSHTFPTSSDVVLRRTRKVS